MSGRKMSSVMACGLVLARQGQGGGAQRRDQSLEALLAGRIQQEAGEAQIVLDDQQHAIARLNIVAVVADLVDQARQRLRRRLPVLRRRARGMGESARLPAVWIASSAQPKSALLLAVPGIRALRSPLDAGRLADRARRVDLRQIERERAALARAGSTRRISPPSKPRQLAADGQAQAGAAVLAAGAAVGLLERLEDDLLLVRRNADAGVASPRTPAPSAPGSAPRCRGSSPPAPAAIVSVTWP